MSNQKAATVRIPDNERWSAAQLDGHVLQPDQWAPFLAAFFPNLPLAAREVLRSEIIAALAQLITRNEEIHVGMDFAKARRPSGGKGNLSAIEKLEKGLQMAADAWTELHGEPVPGVPFPFDPLPALAAQAIELRKRIEGHGDAKAIASPWPEFVCAVAKSCNRAGLDTPRWGRAYEEPDKAPLFYKFMWNLNKALPEIAQKPSGDGNQQAFWREVSDTLVGA